MINQSLFTSERKKEKRKEFISFLLHAIGWVAFSLDYNVLNSTMAIIYPKILEGVSQGGQYDQVYSMINFFTTLLSSFLLPFIGSIIDELRVIKKTMIVSNFVVTILTLVLFYVGKISDVFDFNGVETLELVLDAILYVFSMFFLRFAVMSNNALLTCFKRKQMVGLSLMSNFGGFSTILVALLVMSFLPKDYFFPDPFWGLSNSYWWLLIANFVSFVIMGATLLAPADEKKEDDVKKGLCTIVKNSIVGMYDTMKNFCHEKYLKAWIFLFAYLFYSTSGTIFCIYISQVFISIYHLELSEVVNLNIYYTLFMVFGVVIGICMENFNKKKHLMTDVLVLLAQNFLFVILLLVVFFFITFKIPYVFVLIVAIYIGLLYSWNASVSRGLMSKLTPLEKKCEFMAYYSAFTYLGISLVSLLNTISNLIFNIPQILFVLLVIWTIPSFIFFVWLIREINKGNKKKLTIEEKEKLPAKERMKHMEDEIDELEKSIFAECCK